MKLLTCFALITCLYGFNVKKDLKVFKWKIKDWEKTFYLDRPSDDYLGFRYSSGTAKTMNLYFSDSSSIHILVDPPGFDALDREFIYAKFLLIQRFDVLCTDSITDIDRIVHENPVFYGQLDNGNYWKENWKNRLKICYLNVRKEKLDIYERAIFSFREGK